MYTNINDLIAASQQADLQQEGERLKREEADRRALLAKRRAAGLFNTSQLLAKMVGDEAEASPDVPKAAVPKEQTNASAFPPPPLGK